MVEVVERERLEGGLRGDFVRVFLCACVSLIAFLSRLIGVLLNIMKM